MIFGSFSIISYQVYESTPDDCGYFGDDGEQRLVEKLNPEAIA
ncbi:hypothetical protein [Calothrix sp. PCC 7507]|nr:hypothetical protein [Calothrix sp. PCC 7507]